MYVHCKNTDCFWHSDIEPNKCIRGLIIIGEDCGCAFYNPPERKRKSRTSAKSVCNGNCESCAWYE